ncbi:MAG: DnaD domain protein [Coprobacillus sp.]|nr:DnaD domain protein [Coprobacillus sp.]
MKVLSQSDYLSVSMVSLVADYDRETIVNLYEPIIGFEAVALYFTFLSEAKNQEVLSMSTHESLFNRMGINTTDFISAREKLEGIGLLKTYIEETSSTIYHYEVYAPHTPSDFFNNTIYYGLFKQAIGESEAERIKSLYKTYDDSEKGRDISSSFQEVYTPDLSNPIFQESINNEALKGTNRSKVNSDFSYEKFFMGCEKFSPVNTITEKSLSKKEMEEISRLATLNGLNEEQIAQVITSSYDVTRPKGQRIDFSSLREKIIFSRAFRSSYVNRDDTGDAPRLVSSDSMLGKKIDLMETTAPAKYLSIRTEMAEPAPADLILIDDISSKYHLANSVINALIDYTLATQNGTLPRLYMEKVAASLVRAKVSCALDAMEYLNSVAKKRKKKPDKPPTYSEEESSDTSEELNSERENKNSEISEEEWDALMKEMDNG